jgi:hypothetical protein
MNKNMIYEIRQLNIETIAMMLGMEVRQHKCRCFNHDDHHPSLHFNVRKNIWHCFVCNIGGDGISLVMKYRNISFIEACEWLCNTFGIAMTNDSNEQTKTKTITPNKNIMDRIRINNIVFLDPMVVEKSLSTGNSFCRSLVANNIFTWEQMLHASETYRLGATNSGGTIFWQINREEQICDGKVMHYGSDCHRDKEKSPIWVSWIMKHRQHKLSLDARTEKCLFGLHLLSVDADADDVEIAVVESEKTAVICSELFTLKSMKEKYNISDIHIKPNILWMATGGISNISTKLLMPLKGYKITLFPDTDTDGSAYRHWTDMAEKISREMDQKINISNILEKYASAEQKENKIDIADWITER